MYITSPPNRIYSGSTHIEGWQFTSRKIVEFLGNGLTPSLKTQTSLMSMEKLKIGPSIPPPSLKKKVVRCDMLVQTNASRE